MTDSAGNAVNVIRIVDGQVRKVQGHHVNLAVRDPRMASLTGIPGTVAVGLVAAIAGDPFMHARGGPVILRQGRMAEIRGMALQAEFVRGIIIYPDLPALMKDPDRL